MLQSLELFLIAAEELSFSKAAQRAYVTQQCLSDHIRRLEQQYGVSLFERKPRISLTEQGKALQSAAQNMKIIEMNLEDDLQEISGQKRGTLNFGINATRARILLPEFYPAYYEKFPKVNLNIQLGETRSMEALLLNGKLDMFLGIDTVVQPLFSARMICDNPLYCVISQDTFASVFDCGISKAFTAQARQCLSDGMDLTRLLKLPFLLCLPESTTRQMVVKSLSRQNIYLKNSISISDYETHFDLCSHNPMATICPSIAINQAVITNQTLHSQNRLMFFPIRCFPNTLKVHLVCHKDRHFTNYMNAFTDMLIDEVHRQELKAETYLREQVFS